MNDSRNERNMRKTSNAIGTTIAKMALFDISKDPFRNPSDVKSALESSLLSPIDMPDSRKRDLKVEIGVNGFVDAYPERAKHNCDESSR